MDRLLQRKKKLAEGGFVEEPKEASELSPMEPPRTMKNDFASSRKSELDSFFPYRNGASSPAHSPVAALSRESEAVSPKLRVERIPKSLFMSSVKSETKMERKEKKGPSPIPVSRNGKSPIQVIPKSPDLAHQTESPSFGSKSGERSVLAEGGKSEKEEEEEEKKNDEGNTTVNPPLTIVKASNEEVLQRRKKFEEITAVGQSENSKDRNVPKKTPKERTSPLSSSCESHWVSSNENPVKANPEVVEAPALDDAKVVQGVSHDADMGTGDASPIETFKFEASQPSKLTIGRNTTFDLDNLLNDVDFETELMELAPPLDTIHEEASQTAEKEEASQTAEKEEAGDDLVDASEMWECEVVYDYQAETEQSISVYAGQHVWGVVESGDWTQIRTEDGRVGLDSLSNL